MTTPERRRAPRVDERIPLSLSVTDAELRAETTNISAAGAYCTLDRFIPPMSKLQVSFQLPGNARRGPIHCTAVVVRVEPAITDGHAMRYQTALFFSDISERDRETVAQFVHQRLSAAHPTD